jgi:hypothetical protein
MSVIVLTLWLLNFWISKYASIKQFLINFVAEKRFINLKN